MIFLVIFAILASGYNVAEGLVEAYRSRAAIAEIEKIKTSINGFTTQYHALPGDMTDASEYWPGAKDGNGDGKVLWSTKTKYEESLPAWKHLYEAGFRTEKLTGIKAQGDVHVVGKNIARAGNSDNEGFLIINKDIICGGGGGCYSAGFYPVPDGNMISWASTKPNQAISGQVGEFVHGAFTAKEVYDMDLKLDDGLPSSGKVIATEELSLGLIGSNCIYPNSGKILYLASLPGFVVPDVDRCRMHFYID